MTTGTLVKHSERSNRNPCRVCWRGGNDDKSLVLYWYHDTTAQFRTDTKRVCKEHHSTSWVLMESDGTLHSDRCTGKASSSALAPAPAVPASIPQAPVSVPDAPQAPDMPATNGQAPTGRLDAIQALIDLLAPKVDAEQVNAIIDARLAALTVLTTVKIVKPDGTVKRIDGAHKDLPDILTAIQADENVLMVGPMGTGKSTMAKHVADALSRPFSCMSVGPQTSKSDILGYMTADGTYIPSLFRIAWEAGHVWLFDEMDAAHPGVLTIINMAMANGIMAFPDGMVAKHEDTVLMGAANTFGRGPDRMYVGRQALDAATLDRFTVVEMMVDESLEFAMCHNTALDSAMVDKVIDYIRTLRRNAEDHKMAVGFSPRASYGVCKLVAKGWSMHKAINGRVRKGLSDQDWSKVTAGAIVPR